MRPCIFEYIYFSRPDSILAGKTAYEYRKNFGAQLAKEDSFKADLVVPVPDSGNAAALGYAQEKGLGFDLGLICLLYTSPSPRDVEESRMPSSA